MKTCVVWGDMLSDSVSDQYPSVAMCDACAEGESKGSEDQDPAIVSVDHLIQVLGILNVTSANQG